MDASSAEAALEQQQEEEGCCCCGLMERFQIACRIHDLKFDLKDLIDTYLNPALDHDVQRQAMRRMREVVERKQAAAVGKDYHRGNDDHQVGGNGARDSGDDEQTRKFVRACGLEDVEAQVMGIVDTYFDEDLDDDECEEAIAKLWAKLERDLDARANAVSIRKFKL